MRKITASGPAGLLLMVLLLLPAVSLADSSAAVRSFLFLVQQIHDRTLFNVNEEEWLGKSLVFLFPDRPDRPVSMNQYARIIQDHLEHVQPGEGNVFLTSAVRSLLQALPDPYAAFLSPEEVREESEQHQGNSFYGFGLEMAERSEGVVVAGVLRDSPAAKAGIEPGDRLIRIDGKPVADLRDAFQRIGGNAIDLVLDRNRVRSHLKIFSGPIRLIPFREERFGKTGYIRMEAILPKSDQRFAAAIKRFQDQKLALLVLDLRDCIGGDVNSARIIAGFFLKPGARIYSEKTRQGVTRYDNHDTTHFTIPLVVLVDGATASAAELISGALKDHHAAILYGSRTLGKGYIETTWRFQGGWALRFTTARYLRPSGSEVQGIGVLPDVQCKGSPSSFSCGEGRYGTQLEALLRNLKN